MKNRTLLSELLSAFKIGAGVYRTGQFSLVRTVALALSTTILAAVCIGILFISATYSGINHRNAVRAPRDAEVFTGERPVALYGITSAPDPTGYATIIQLAPVDKQASFSGPPPPGIRTWPLPGHVWLSPSLASGHAIGDETDWGVLTGVISQAGLATPTERFGYARAEHPAAQGRYFPITGFGVNKEVVPILLGDAVRIAPLSQFISVVVVFTLLPAVVFVFIATRTGSLNRSRRITLLYAMGTPTSSRQVVTCGEIAPPVILGTFGAFLLAGVAALRPLTVIPGMSVILQGSDVRAHFIKIFFIGLLVVTFVVATALSEAAAGGNFQSARLSASKQRSRTWLTAITITSMFFLFQSPGWHLNPWAKLILLVISVLASLLTLPFLVSAIVSALSTLVIRTMTSSGTLLVVARQSSARPRVAERIAVGIVVTVGVVGVAQLYLSQLSAPQVAAQGLTHQLRGSVLEITFEGQPASAVEDIRNHLTPDVAVFYVHSTAPEQGAITASCTAIETLGHKCDTLNSGTSLYNIDPRLAEAADWSPLGAIKRQISVSNAPYLSNTSGLILINKNYTPLPVGAIRRAAFEDGLDVQVPGQGWLLGTTLSRHHSRWLGSLGGVGVVIMVIALAVSTSAETKSSVRRTAPLLLLAGRRRAAWTIAAWHQLLPLMLGLFVGLGFYVLISIPLTAGGTGAELSLLAVFIVFTGGLTASLILWIISSFGLLRYLNRQRSGLTL